MQPPRPLSVPRRRPAARLAAYLVALCCLLAGCGAPGSAPPPAPPAVDPGPVQSPPVPATAFPAVITRVVDGDTVLARAGGRGPPLRVRVIGVDTPETVKPHTPVACYGPQASAFTKRLLPGGTTVRASFERGGRLDRYGRQLWDVWLPDGRMLQAVLAAAGTARAYPYAPQLDYADLLGSLAEQARVSARGLWGPPCRGRSFSTRARAAPGPAGAGGRPGTGATRR